MGSNYESKLAWTSDFSYTNWHNFDIIELEYYLIRSAVPSIVDQSALASELLSLMPDRRSVISIIIIINEIVCLYQVLMRWWFLNAFGLGRNWVNILYTIKKNWAFENYRFQCPLCTCSKLSYNILKNGFHNVTNLFRKNKKHRRL